VKKVLFITVFLLAAFLLHAQPKTGSSVPEIQLKDSKGNVVKLSSLKDKVILIDFWASWCGPCRRSIPHLQTLYSKYKEKGFEIYGISVDNNANAWKKAVVENNIKWIQVNDPQGEVAGPWQVTYIPNTYLINKKGKIVAIDAPENALEDMISKLLAE
jgi:peroxiredoxin